MQHKLETNISKLTDLELHGTLIAKAQREREMTIEIIHLLRAVEQRRLFAKRGCSSLHEYCVSILKYSDGAAQRRIQAMRLLKALPTVEEKILSGDLNLTTLSTAQVFFNAQARQNTPVSLECKRNLLESFEGKSRRAVETALYTIAPLAAPLEKERVVSDHIEVKFYLDPKLQKDLERLRELLAHKNTNYSYAELIQELATIALKRLDPELKTSVKGKVDTSKFDCLNGGGEGVVKSKQSSIKQAPTPPAEWMLQQIKGTRAGRTASQIELEVATPPRKLAVSSKAALKQFVWRRDQGFCQFTDPLTGRKCLSKFMLQFEHIQPRALGGEDVPANLELLCATHNQLRAIERFGEKKMAQYIGK